MKPNIRLYDVRHYKTNSERSKPGTLEKVNRGYRELYWSSNTETTNTNKIREGMKDQGNKEKSELKWIGNSGPNSSSEGLRRVSLLRDG